MGQGRHYPRVLPPGGLERVCNLESGDRIQRPRSPILVVDLVVNMYVKGVTVLLGHFEESGYHRGYTISHRESTEEWGWER